jgi:hypothetical protein
MTLLWKTGCRFRLLRRYPERETLSSNAQLLLLFVYGAVRIALVVVLCLFSAADDLTDAISGSLFRAMPPANQVRAGNLAEDDRDDIHHGPAAAIGHIAAVSSYAPSLLNEFVTIADSDVRSVPPRWVTCGRSPPAGS